MTPEDLLALTAGCGLELPKLPKGKGAEWTCAEAGMAAAKVPRASWYALRYSFAGDDTVRAWLEDELRSWVGVVLRPKHWPRLNLEHIGTYDLVSLHMDEERHPRVFNSALEIRPVLMQVDEAVWVRRLQPVYEDVRLQYLNWLANGRHHMREWLDESAA